MDDILQKKNKLDTGSMKNVFFADETMALIGNDQ